MSKPPPLTKPSAVKELAAALDNVLGKHTAPVGVVQPQFTEEEHPIPPEHMKLARGFADDDLGVALLAGTLTKYRLRATKYLAETHATGDFEPGDMLQFDYLAACFLEELGPTGKKAAAAIRTAARDRWQKAEAAGGATLELFRLWVPRDDSGDETSRFDKVLCEVLWADVVKEQAEKERKNHPALSSAVLDTVTTMMAPQRVVVENLRQTTIWDRLDRELGYLDLPAVDLDKLTTVLRRGAKKLGSLTAHRLLRWEIATGYRQWIEDVPDPRRIVVDGGFRALAELVGVPRSKSPELREIVLAQHHLRFDWPGGSVRALATLDEETPARGVRRARIAILLGNVLFPTYVIALNKNTQSQREARRLVPVIDLPPLVGRPADHGKQATLQFHVQSYMRKHVRELVEDGGVYLPMGELERLAELSGVPLKTLPRVLDRWCQDGDDGAAFLERTKPDRYLLGRTHKRAHDFMVEGYKKVCAGRENPGQFDKRVRRRKRSKTK